jgi:hypothetical protein
MSGGGGGGNNQPQFPQEIRDLWGLAQPMAERMGTAGLSGQPLWNVPSMPQVPGPVLPSQEWYSGIAPEVKAGLWAPYQEAGHQLTEVLGSQGQLGSARGGFSGAAGAALGSLAAKGAQNVGMQAWNMTAPQMGQYRDQLYQGALQQRGEVMQAQQAPWSMFPSYMGGMGQMPMYAQPNQMNPWVGALGGGLAGYQAGGPVGGALGGIYGYYAS